MFPQCSWRHSRSVRFYVLYENCCISICFGCSSMPQIMKSVSVGEFLTFMMAKKWTFGIFIRGSLWVAKGYWFFPRSCTKRDFIRLFSCVGLDKSQPRAVSISPHVHCCGETRAPSRRCMRCVSSTQSNKLEICIQDIASRVEPTAAPRLWESVQLNEHNYLPVSINTWTQVSAFWF